MLDATRPSDWTFDGAPTRELTHCYHDYPARMIPQVAGKLIDLFAPEGQSLFDPYCGTGTSLVEGFIRGLDVAGTDLNPLARLIARAKTAVADAAETDRQIARFQRFAAASQPAPAGSPDHIPGISRLDFWFKPAVIEKLARLRGFIDGIESEPVRMFFQVAFSETVRESSNTRNAEFKLYRYAADKLEAFDPDVFGLMAAKLDRNRAGLEQFLAHVRPLDPPPAARLFDFNSVAGVPSDAVAPGSVDIVVTSPPYGDSGTTVAYGQYSRLSAAWLGLPEPGQVDRKLMGGQTAKTLPEFPSPELNAALRRVKRSGAKRALEVAAFYTDLSASIARVAELIRPGGHACYVVGNRKVKGVVLPTDAAVRAFFEAAGFEHVDTFHRAIPNKRMPLRNSPTNAPGVVDTTMAREHIVVMRRGEGRPI